MEGTEHSSCGIRVTDSDIPHSCRTDITNDGKLYMLRQYEAWPHSEMRLGADQTRSAHSTYTAMGDSTSLERSSHCLIDLFALSFAWCSMPLPWLIPKDLC